MTDAVKGVPLVSIIVPTWNGARVLEGALQSLVHQFYPSDGYEIVVADDGSVDDTEAVVSRFKGAGPLVRYVRIRHQGPNAARNAGLAAAASQDLLCFIDDDVEAPPEWLTELASGAARYPKAGCLGGPVWLKLEGRLPRACGKETLRDSRQDYGPTDREVETLIGANMAVRRWAVELAGRFDETMPYWHEETEWQDRLRARGGAVMYVAAAGLWHRRLQSELRLLPLISREFIRARNEVQYQTMTGQPPRAASSLVQLLRGLGHAARRRCAMGFLIASRSAGHLRGLLAIRRDH